MVLLPATVILYTSDGLIFARRSALSSSSLMVSMTKDCSSPRPLLFREDRSVLA